MSKQILVVAAAIENDQDEVLVAQRPQGGAIGGLWEFPGGKIEFGESPQQALAREIQEELALRVEVTNPFGVSHILTTGPMPQHIVLLGFRARLLDQSVQPKPIGVADWRWLSRGTEAKEVLRLLPWAPADLELVRAYFPN